MSAPLAIGTSLGAFGVVQAVQFTRGERYYMAVNRYGVVSLVDHATAISMAAPEPDRASPHRFQGEPIP